MRNIIQDLGLSAVILGIAAVAGMAVAEADEIHRHGRIYGPHGVSGYHSVRGCDNGTCYYEGSARGPHGRTASRSGSITKIAPGEYGYTRSYTGWRGNTVSRSGTIHVR